MRPDGSIDWASVTLLATTGAAGAVILLIPRIQQHLAERDLRRALRRMLRSYSLPVDLPAPLHSHRSVTETPIPVAVRSSTAAPAPEANMASPRTGAPRPPTVRWPQVGAADLERPGVVTSSSTVPTGRGTS